MKKNNNIKLSDIPREENFKVPNGYFESFGESIMDQIENNETKNRNRVIKLIKPILSMAASFLIIFSLIYFSVKITDKEQHVNYNTINELDYLAYSSENEILNAVYESNEKESINNETIETVLSTSISDYELMILYN